jgi:hypothetical protein
MADEHDPEVSRRYRELAGEEPPRELDQAILAAARRSVEKPHAPLVTPSGRHRWYFSLGAAAVIVLAVAVTYHMQREQPDPDSPVVAPSTRAKTEPASKPEAIVTPQPRPRAPERARELAREPAVPPPPVFVPDQKSRREGQRELAREAPGGRLDAAGAPASVPESAPEMRMQRDAAPAASAARPMQAPVVETPERMIERIVQLRKEGKHEEADKVLAELKRRYPDYRLPENVVRP